MPKQAKIHKFDEKIRALFFVNARLVKIYENR